MKLEKEGLNSTWRGLPTCQCEVCGYRFDCASHMGDDSARPRTGDFTLCLKCGELYVFNEDMTIRVPTLAEMLKLEPKNDREIKFLQTKIRKERPIG